MYARKQTNWVGLVLGFLVVLLLGGVSAFATWEFFQIKDLKNQLQVAKAETGSLKTNAFESRQDLEAAQALIVAALQEDVSQSQARVLREIAAQRELPKNESPTFALVTDITKLANEQFFVNGANGDYIIAYKKANLSLLYRPTEKKIINTGTVSAEG